MESAIVSDNRIKVILDTNVFIAAYWSPRSASARIIRACIEGGLRAVYTPQIRRETLTMLRRARTSAAYARSLEEFWSAAEEVKGVSAGGVRADDPDDQKFLEAALGGEADFLVTNDAHLLKVEYLGSTQVLTPASLVRLLS